MNKGERAVTRLGAEGRTIEEAGVLGSQYHMTGDAVLNAFDHGALAYKAGHGPRLIHQIDAVEYAKPLPGVSETAQKAMQKSATYDMSPRMNSFATENTFDKHKKMFNVGNGSYAKAENIGASGDRSLTDIKKYDIMNSGLGDTNQFTKSNSTQKDIFNVDKTELTEVLSERIVESLPSAIVSGVEKMLPEGFSVKEGLVALVEPDKRNILNIDYREGIDFEKLSPSTVIAAKLDAALNKALETRNYQGYYIINDTLEKLESFDDSTITAAYYLNDSDGASSMGHSGVLLKNEAGESFLFSFYPQDTSKLKDSASEMRVHILDKNETAQFLAGDIVMSAATSGYGRHESYDNAHEFAVTPEQGKAMLEQGAAITAKGFSYNLLEQNCDHVALSILKKGDIDATKLPIPNLSYKVAVGIDNVKNLLDILYPYLNVEDARNRHTYQSLKRT